MVQIQHGQSCRKRRFDLAVTAAWGTFVLRVRDVAELLVISMFAQSHR
jgi:hypothetical protein